MHFGRFSRRAGLAALFSVVWASVAGAGGGGGGGKSSKKDEGPSNRFKASWTLEDDTEEEVEPEEFSEEVHRAVDFPAFAAPLTRGERLENYAFLNIRVLVVDGGDVWKARENIHIIRDAFVRAVHKAPVSDDDGNTLDFERARTVLGQAYAEVIADPPVDTIEFLNVDVRRG
ncbi:MAG: hypothetical protein ACFB2Z_12295 [Maricaulaceae bacterium]